MFLLVKAIDYKIKSVVLNKHIDLLKLERKISFSFYAYYDLRQNGVVHKNALPLDIALNWQNSMQDTNAIYNGYTLAELYKQAGYLNKSFNQRKLTLKNRISNLLECGNCFFLTLTFTDNVLANTTAETRRRYVARQLKQHFPLGYVANIDFGAENGREHYHAVVVSDTDRISNSNGLIWSYGALNFKAIHTPNAQALAKYISKLSNHAIKETTRRSALLYSR